MINPANEGGEINNKKKKQRFLLFVAGAPCVFQLKERKRKKEREWDSIHLFIMPTVSPEVEATEGWKTRRWGGRKSVTSTFNWLLKVTGQLWGEGQTGKNPLRIHGTEEYFSPWNALKSPKVIRTSPRNSRWYPKEILKHPRSLLSPFRSRCRGEKQENDEAYEGRRWRDSRWQKWRDSRREIRESKVCSAALGILKTGYSLNLQLDELSLTDIAAWPIRKWQVCSKTPLFIPDLWNSSLKIYCYCFSVCFKPSNCATTSRWGRPWDVVESQ